MALLPMTPLCLSITVGHQQDPSCSAWKLILHVPWLGLVTILPAHLLKGTLRISIISSPVFVGILPGGAGEPGPGLGCSVALFMCMEFVLFELYKVSFAQHRIFFFSYLKVSRGKPLSPAPSLHPILQLPLATVTTLLPGQREPGVAVLP